LTEDYSKQQFKKHPTGKVHDSSSPKHVTPKQVTPKPVTPKSKSKSVKTGSKSPKSKSLKSAPKPKSKYRGIPTMTINLRAAKNWKNAKTKMSAYNALTRKNHGKTHVPSSTKKLLAKVDKIVAELSSDHREMVEYRDMIDLLDREGIKIKDEEADILRNYLRDKYQIS